MDIEHGIYWDQSWSPVRGCSHASPGCTNCWAERMAGRFSIGPVAIRESGVVHRFNGPFSGFATPDGWTGHVELIESELQKPLHWRKPRIVPLNWMGDLFHEQVPDEAIDRVFTTMVAADWHTYLILTKRAKRMRKYFASGRHDGGNGPDRATYHLDGKIALGVSCEDQPRAYERINDLRRTPASMRFVSIEPMLGAVNVVAWLEYLDWVIVGGESGPGARPLRTEWAQSIVDQCRSVHVSCFVKQLGAHVIQDGERRIKRDRKGADMDEWPHALRVRELPVMLKGGA